MHRRATCCLRWLLGAIALGILGCEGSDTPASKVPTTQPRDLVSLPAQKPQYDFAAGLEQQHPEVVGFMRHFLETCLAGDYGAYRAMVTRRSDPESRARFERILHTLSRLSIESIVSVKVPDLEFPAYLVVSRAEFIPQPKAERARDRGPRRVAILVLKEDGEWRFALAPPAYQPREDGPASSSPATTSAPSYPWDDDGDE